MSNLPPFPNGPDHGGENPYNNENPYGNESDWNSGPGQVRLVQGDGKPDIKKSIGFGFRAVMDDPGVWLLVAFLLIMASAVLGFIISMVQLLLVTLFSGDLSSASNPSGLGQVFQNFCNTFIGLVFSAYLINAALQKMNGQTPTLSSAAANINYKNLILVSLINAAILVLALLPVLIFGYEAPAQPATEFQISPRMLAVFFSSGIIPILIAPFLLFPLYFLIDGNNDVGDCFRRSFELGKSHYLTLLLFAFMQFLIIIIGFLACCIGLIFATPVNVLANAFMFRKLTGRTHPEF